MKKMSAVGLVWMGIFSATAFAMDAADVGDIRGEILDPPYREQQKQKKPTRSVQIVKPDADATQKDAACAR